MLCFKNCSICPCSVRHPLGNPQRRRPSGQNYWRPRQGLGHLVKRQSYYMHLLLLGADLITKLDFGQFRYFWWDVMRPCSLQDGENCLTCTAINNLSVCFFVRYLFVRTEQKEAHNMRFRILWRRASRPASHLSPSTQLAQAHQWARSRVTKVCHCGYSGNAAEDNLKIICFVL